MELFYKAAILEVLRGITYCMLKVHRLKISSPYMNNKCAHKQQNIHVNKRGHTKKQCLDAEKSPRPRHHHSQVIQELGRVQRLTVQWSLYWINANCYLLCCKRIFILGKVCKIGTGLRYVFCSLFFVCYRA